MPDVFELTIACGARTESIRASNDCLASRRSTIASMIQSALESFDRSSSNPPVRTSRRPSDVKNGSGLSFVARSRPSPAACALTSSSSAGNPAFATCAAICAPIVPAPSTATDRIRMIRPTLRGLGDPSHKHVDNLLCLRDEAVATFAEDPIGGHFVESAEEQFGRQRRVYLWTKNAGHLTFNNDVADKTEVLANVSRGKALHEFCRLPQFDLKDDRECPVVAQSIEVKPSDLTQSGDRIVNGRDAAAALGNCLLHRALEDRDQKVVLAAKVEVDGAGRHTRGARHVGNLGVEKAACREGIDGGAEDGFAFVCGFGDLQGRTASGDAHE